jgi:GNAT superfamily N-acetyltransferase
MFKVEKVTDENRQRVIDFLSSDVLRHFFALYDIQHDAEHTAMFAAFENGDLKGYILVYTALEFPSVILECNDDTVEKLIEETPKDGFIMHAPIDLLPAIKRKFPNAKHYVEDYMLIKTNEASFFTSQNVRKLRRSDAANLAMLLSSRKERLKATPESCADLITRMQMYGVFTHSELVSCAGSFLQLPQVWLVGGVYTHPEHRNKGYATLATSAITEEALKASKAAVLFVRSDNYSAVHAYEKIGYKRIGKRLWVDVGTGIRP